MEYETKILNYKGQKIYTYSFGSGEKPILALPSYPFSGLYFLWLLKKYDMNSARIITFDIPGWFGRSENIFKGNKFTIEEICEIALQTLKLHGVEQCGLMGYSFGGAIALKLTEEHPDVFKKLVLASTIINGKIARQRFWAKLAIFFSVIKLSSLVKLVVINRFMTVMNDLYKSSDFSPEILDEYKSLKKAANTKVLKDSLFELFASDYTDKLKILNQSKLPIMVVSSRNELYIFKQQARIIRQILDHEKSVYLTGEHNDLVLKPDAKTTGEMIRFLTK